MRINDLLLVEFDEDTLERVPSGADDFAPHPKSAAGTANNRRVESVKQ
jgi:hypothetical protein